MELNIKTTRPKIVGASDQATKAFSRMLQRATKANVEWTRRELRKTTKHWKTKVDFYVRRRTVGQDALAILVGTDNQIWNWTNYGTKPHVIEARNAPMLVFKTGGKAKTTPNVLKSSKGKRGTQTVRKFRVNHPGTKARRWDAIIAAQTRKRLDKDTKAVVRDWRREWTDDFGRFK